MGPAERGCTDQSRGPRLASYLTAHSPSELPRAVDAGAYSVHTGEPGLPPILVVDDNHDNAEIIRQYLEIRGYPISVAHNGDEALALYETVKPVLGIVGVAHPHGPLGRVAEESRLVGEVAADVVVPVEMVGREVGQDARGGRDARRVVELERRRLQRDPVGLPLAQRHLG